MGWVEQTGERAWRVRYRRDGGSTGSVGGFGSEQAARAYLQDMQADQRRRIWLDPSGTRVTVAQWATAWVPTLDVEPRTEENYRAYLRNHILPRWGSSTLGSLSPIEITAWRKRLHSSLAASTVAGILTVFSMLLDDAVDERLISSNPVRRRRRRGRRRHHRAGPTEKVWATPVQVLQVAEQAKVLGGLGAWLLIITAAWTGARWGELVGLHRDNIHLDVRARRGRIVVDPDVGALHESSRRLWLGPPKTRASARTIQLPPFLVLLLGDYLVGHEHPYVFTSIRGRWLRRSTFIRRVFRPAVDGNSDSATTVRTRPVCPGLTFHGLRHSHKTWMIADHVPEIAQARRLGHHLANRIVETYSHVAAPVERHLLRSLQRLWHRATHRAGLTVTQRDPRWNDPHMPAGRRTGPDPCQSRALTGANGLTRPPDAGSEDPLVRSRTAPARDNRTSIRDTNKPRRKKRSRPLTRAFTRR